MFEANTARTEMFMELSKSFTSEAGEQTGVISKGASTIAMHPRSARESQVKDSSI